MDDRRIALARHGADAELRVAVDRVKPWVWLMFVNVRESRTTRDGRTVPGTFASYPLEARDEIPRFGQLIAHVRETGRAETLTCQLKPDHLIQLHADRHPVDAKAEGRVPDLLVMTFHNLRRSHESRIGRRAQLVGAEVGALLDALDQARDEVLARGVR
jgi:hypothetical protein